MTVYFPFTICTEDYAKYGVAAEYTYNCELDYPITNINNQNRLSYAKMNAAATKYAGFEIDWDDTQTFNLILIELSRPYEMKAANVALAAYYGAAWHNITLMDNKKFIADTNYHLPGQINQYILLDPGNLPCTKIRMTFEDDNAANQIEIRRVICTLIIQNVDGTSDMIGPSEQSHQNVGKIMIPLLHGNAFRTQSFGALKQDGDLHFPQIKNNQVKFFEDLESDYPVFGIIDWSGRFIECTVIPNGLTIKHNGVDALGTPFFDVKMQVQEI